MSMSQSGPREVEHEMAISAPATAVYHLIAAVENWPRIFPPTLYVDHVERNENTERIRIWATVNGEAKNWTSRRTLAPDDLRIDFRQEVSAPPVAAMGGAWVIEATSEDESRVRLLHHYRSVDDDPEDLRWIDEAVDRNSRTELAALKKHVEAAHADEELTFSFEDTLQIRGAAEDAFGFVNEAQLWPDRLPHVADVRFGESTSGLQTLEMDSRAKDGSVHATKSYRVSLPHHKIAYKQVTLPPLMTLHTGCWTFAEGDAGVTASSQHTVTLDMANAARLLGSGTTVEQARDYVRNALSTNSLITLRHAKQYAEAKAT